MTRASVRRALSRLYWLLAIVLTVLLAAKFADIIPGMPPDLAAAAGRLYEFARDMSLLIAIGCIAHLANIFQKRSIFVTGLKEEWRNIVHTKSALLSMCEKPYLATDDYLAAFYKLDETIEMMRIVYRNAGETSGLAGLYPFEPLRDMGRALEALDPRHTNEVSAEKKATARKAILQAFKALEETFLEELDLEQPDHPLLVSGARRVKAPGADVAATVIKDRQQRGHDRGRSEPDIDTFLSALRAENAGATADAPEQKP